MKANVFSRKVMPAGVEAKPRSLDDRCAGNQSLEAHRQSRSYVEIPLERSLGGDFKRDSGAVFRSADGERSIAFRASGDHVTHLFLDLLGEPFAFERVRPDETVNAVLLGLGAAGAALLSLLIVSTLRGVVALVRRSQRTCSPLGERVMNWLTVGSAFWSLIMLAALVLALGQWKEWLQGAPAALVLATAMATCVPFLALGWVFSVAVAWRRSYWGLARRLHFTVGAMAALLLAGFFIRFHVWIGGI